MGAFTNSFSFGSFQLGTLLNQTPDIPTGLIVTALSSSSIKINWTNGVKAQDGISIERSDNGTSGWSEVATVTNGATYTNTGLSNNYYYYRIRSYKGTKYSDYTSVTSNLIPLVIYDGNTVAIYDSTDLSTITKDTNNYISQWNDKLGGGKDLKQPTGTAQPQYTSDGVVFLSSRSGGMKTDDFTLIPQPATDYLLVKQTGWGNNYYITNSKAKNGFVQSSSSPKIKYDSAFGSALFDLNLNEFHRLTAQLRSSYGTDDIYLDNNLVSNNDSGINGFERLTFGGNYGLFSASFIVRLRIFRKVFDSEANRLAIWQYIDNFNGFFLT